MSSANQAQTPPNTTSSAFKVEAGDGRMGRSLYVVGDDIRVKISSQDTNSAFAVLDGRTQPRHGPPLHLHHRQDEWWYVLEGRLLFVVDGQEIVAGTGDTVFAPKGTRHTHLNIGAMPARYIVAVVPGGLDIFFEELSAVVPPGTVPDPASLAPLFRKHGLELLGPPLGAR